MYPFQPSEGRCYSDARDIVCRVPLNGGIVRSLAIMDVKRLRQRVVELEEQLSSSLQHQGNEVYTIQAFLVALPVSTEYLVTS